jgi:TolA-binding protein
MLDRPDSAAKVLQKCVAGGDPGYSDEARFFLAKALLRTGDRASAAATFDAVSRSKSARAEDARRLRDALAGILER